MKVTLTNKLGLPEAIVKAIENDPYSSGGSDYTATGLLKPARMAQLMKTLETTEDASERLYSLQGQVMHLILERAGEGLKSEGYIVEKRFYMEIEYEGTKKSISAQIDLFNPSTGVLSDYKYTSVASASYGLKEDHRLQLNLQAELLRKNGYTVNRAEVVLLLRDWSAERDYEGYPDSPVQKQEVPLMSSEYVTMWVSKRVEAHEAAKVSLPLCSNEERWSRPSFAVMKAPTDARAVRVFSSKDEANAYVLTAKAPNLLVIERSGKSIRCLRYCPARFVCEQAKTSSPAPVMDEDGFIKL